MPRVPASAPATGAPHPREVVGLGAQHDVPTGGLGPYAQRQVAHVVHGHITVPEGQVLGQRQGVAMGAHHPVDAVAVEPEPPGPVIGYAASPQPAVVLPGSAHHELVEPGDLGGVGGTVHQLDTWTAVKWFAGMDTFPGDLPNGDEVPAVGEDFRAWQVATAPVYYFQQHQDAVADWLVVRDDHPEELRRAVSTLRWLRNSMRHAGLEPPLLAPELERLVATQASRLTTHPDDTAGGATSEGHDVRSPQQRTQSLP